VKLTPTVVPQVPQPWGLSLKGSDSGLQLSSAQLRVAGVTEKKGVCVCVCVCVCVHGQPVNKPMPKVM
jgi:hypothetical protein